MITPLQLSSPDYISLPRVIEILRRHSKKADEMKLTKSTTKIEGVSCLAPSLSLSWSS